MNKGIAHILLTRIRDLSFIDLYGGIVSIQEQEDANSADGSIAGKKIVKRFPVSCDVIDRADCHAQPGTLVPFIPDSNRKGILYIEDNGVECLGQSGIFLKYRSQLRIVVWLNTKHIELNPCHELSMPVMTNLITRLTGNPYNQNHYSRIMVTLNKIPKTGKEIFDKYTYDIATSQYLMPPFEYFALDMSVTFSIQPNCINQITTKDPAQC